MTRGAAYRSTPAQVISLRSFLPTGLWSAAPPCMHLLPSSTVTNPVMAGHLWGSMGSVAVTCSHQQRLFTAIHSGAIPGPVCQQHCTVHSRSAGYGTLHTDGGWSQDHALHSRQPDRARRSQATTVPNRRLVARSGRLAAPAFLRHPCQMHASAGHCVLAGRCYRTRLGQSNASVGISAFLFTAFRHRPARRLLTGLR